MLRGLFDAINSVSIVIQIFIGFMLGVLVALTAPELASYFTLFGNLFVGALKAIAPILVFFLVISSISRHQEGTKTNMSKIILLYLSGTFLAALAAVFASFSFPTTLSLAVGAEALKPPGNIAEVLLTLVMNMVANPVDALVNANYIGILTWSVLLGVAFRSAPENTKDVIFYFAGAISKIIRWVIHLAPIGIFGLVASSISANGLYALVGYAKLLTVLLGTMLFMALVVNPLIVFLMIRRNPYPLVFTCLKESGIYAFCTRSSAANIPVNMALCRKLGLNPDTYAVSIPLGATINMMGAAITITILALSAVHTLGIPVDFPTAILLSIMATIGACGASGVAGGSLLLVPMACSLFGISDDISMQVVAVGFIIGILQDSTETALNSSTDVLFTAIADENFKNRRD